jgi:glycosyltransferase involved in cell wall biosynthesis
VAHGWAFNEDRPPWVKRGLKILQWLTIMACHVTITVSEMAARQVQYWPWVKQRTWIIHDGLSSPTFVTREEARAELVPDWTDPTIPWIGTISELHRNKGLDYLLEALALVKKRGKDFRAVMIGGGELRSELEERTRALGLSDQVRFVGAKPLAGRLLKALDMFTLTSRTEALSYAILEAGYAELPIVASRVGGIPEIISSPEFGVLVEAGSVLGYADAIVSLLDHPEQAKKMGACLHQYVLSTFSLNQMIKETERIIMHDKN